MSIAAPKIEWPDGKAFAFTIVDDTDVATVENTKPIYDLLVANGLRTTKTVWPLCALGAPVTGGDSLENLNYRSWILDLQAAGFEIALHGISDGSSHRERIVEGLDRFHAILGKDPAIHINHTGQKEAIYWGAQRLDPPLSWVYKAYRDHRGPETYSGPDQSSPYFWGDLCQQRIKYVRNLAFRDINTLKMDPFMPYHDPRRPYVRHWFSSSYGSGVNAFCNLISEVNQDRLISEGGACIVYTHFGSSFYPLRDDFKRLIRRLSAQPGWFVPATTLLEFLGSIRGWPNVAEHKFRFQGVQWNWLMQQALRKVAS